MFLLGDSLQKGMNKNVFSNGSGLDWERLFSSKYASTAGVQDSGNNVISCIKVLPSGECSRSICPVHMQQRLPVPGPLYIRTCCM